MFGLFFAAICAAGIYRIWRPGRFGCGRGPGRHGRLRWLMRELNATPEQEAAIRQTAEEVRGAFAALNPRARLANVASALSAETLNADELRQQLNDPGTGPVAEAVFNGIVRLRAVLRLDQRGKLAAMLSRGQGCSF